MEPNPFRILDAVIRHLLPIGVMAMLLVIAAMALLVGAVALLTRRTRRRYTAAEEEGRGLAFFTWRDAE